MVEQGGQSLREHATARQLAEIGLGCFVLCRHPCGDLGIASNIDLQPAVRICDHAAEMLLDDIALSGFRIGHGRWCPFRLFVG
jgi:hypothetical protein